MKKILTAIVALFIILPAFAESLELPASEAAAQKEQKEGKKKKEVKYNENGEIIKTGISFGPVPVVAFDSDRGFQYGALLNLYNFGDGSSYPNPKSTWYFEASAYTKGSQKYIVNYDKRDLFPGVRMSICTGFYHDKALDFYGFNGYQSVYDLGLMDFAYDNDERGQKLQAKADAGKFPKAFYRLSRQQVKAKADFTGEILKNFYWEAGYNFMWTRINDFHPSGYAVLPQGTTAAPAEPYSLYSLYKAWGLISEDEANGGITSALRLGLMYDTRNVENNPTRGIWAEAHISAAPKWLGTKHDHYKVTATMRQYLPLGTEKLVFAYRLAYQGFLGGKAPWYQLPFYTNMGPKADNDALGGSKTARGLLMNRIQALQTGFYNLELRWRFVDFRLFNQNIAFAVNAFQDGAMIFQGYDMTMKNNVTDPNVKAAFTKFVNQNADHKLHMAAGAGIRFIMNQNFIIACEYAKCFNRQDGNTALYINTGFLF